MGIIIVEYSIVYLPPGVTNPAMGDTSVFANAAGLITMSNGEAEASIQVNIASNAFLEQEGSFWLNLTGVLLSSCEYQQLVLIVIYHCDVYVVTFCSKQHFTNIRVIFSKNRSSFKCITSSASRGCQWEN